MATLGIPNTFTNGTAAIATEVNANFNAVKTFSEAVAAGTNIDDGAITYPFCPRLVERTKMPCKASLFLCVPNWTEWTLK